MRLSGTTCALLLCVTQLTLAAVDNPPSGENREAGARDAGRRLSSTAPEVLLGDRLFFETRFAQYFFAHSNGDVNAPLKAGDPVVDQVLRPGRASLEGPFRGRSMSSGTATWAMTPFACSRKPNALTLTSPHAVPSRCEAMDSLRQCATRPPWSTSVCRVRFHACSTLMRSLRAPRTSSSRRSLGATWAGNYERAAAVAHIARVIREDRGTHPRHVKTLEDEGIPYRVVMAGNDPSLPEYLKIPDEFRLDVQSASPAEILQAIARLIHAYMDSIRFGAEDTHREAGSPYDRFSSRTSCPLNRTRANRASPMRGAYRN